MTIDADRCPTCAGAETILLRGMRVPCPTCCTTHRSATRHRELRSSIEAHRAQASCCSCFSQLELSPRLRCWSHMGPSSGQSLQGGFSSNYASSTSSRPSWNTPAPHWRGNRAGNNRLPPSLLVRKAKASNTTRRNAHRHGRRLRSPRAASSVASSPNGDAPLSPFQYLYRRRPPTRADES
jgi:hypothetical protein